MDMSGLPPSFMVEIATPSAPALSEPLLDLTEERMRVLHGGLIICEEPQNKPAALSGLPEPSSGAQKPVTSPESILVAEKPLLAAFNCAEIMCNSEEAVKEGAMVVCELLSGVEMMDDMGEDTVKGCCVEGTEPTPLNLFHPRGLDWVIQTAMELKHVVGIKCVGFEDEFLALSQLWKLVINKPHMIPHLVWAKKKKERENSRGLLGNGSLNISHLLFAGDTLIFCGAHLGYIQSLRALLFCFEAASGLKVNLSKSELVSVGNVHEVAVLAALL
ncbi:hypothetical protein I3760_06G051600 [Carya illinoinensis]|nr:hypothetical protein I3760_06G051600 [Carya illinoinensis]